MDQLLAYYVHTAFVLRMVRTCQTAGSVVVLWDHIITFSQEVEHIWCQPFSFGTLNYVLIRYIGDTLAILNMISFLREFQTQQKQIIYALTILHSCQVYFFAQSWLIIFVLFLIQLTLQARIYALYRGSKKILTAMIFGYVCEIAAMLTILIFIAVDARITNEVLPGLYICADMHGPSFYRPYIVWLPFVIFDGILCLLAAWGGISEWMSGYYARRLDGVHLANVVVKDNASYFLCILVACVLNVLVSQFLGLLWIQVSEEFPASMEVMIGCRMILNLRSSLVPDIEKEENFIRDDEPWQVLHPFP